MTEKLILEKLEKMERKVDKIEVAVGLIAVQTERIDNVSKQVNSLWTKYDAAFGPGGTVAGIREFQAGCPRQTIDKALTRQWVAIGLIGTAVTGGLLKAFGVF